MIFNCKSGSSLHCDCVQSIIKNIRISKIELTSDIKYLKTNLLLELNLEKRKTKIELTSEIELTSYCSYFVDVIRTLMVNHHKID